MTRPVCIVGVGSPAGDDGVGWAVVRALRGGAGLPGVTCHLADGGQRLLELVEGVGTLVVVDALADPAAAGAIQRFDWPDLRLAALRPGSTHHLRLADSLQLAAVLGLLPARVTIWTISGASFQPESGLSPAVAAAVPRLAQQLAAEWLDDGPPRKPMNDLQNFTGVRR